MIDVGANIGFFTARFADKVGPAGKVLAIECEDHNLNRLRQRVDRFVASGVVEILAGAAANTDGIVALQVNPDHPGGHRLAASGVAVAAYTLDGVVERTGRRKVDFVKIDVQGAEALVLAGAGRMLARDRPALWVEVDDPALRHMGSDAVSLCGGLIEAGYGIFHLRRHAAPLQITLGDVPALSGNGNYANFLFLPRAR